MTSKYTKSAKGQQCQVRIPGVCNHNPETVVFAHLSGAGIGRKHLDIHGSYACSDCHDAVDGRIPTGYERWRLIELHMEGMVRTQVIMIKMGVLVL